MFTALCFFSGFSTSGAFTCRTFSRFRRRSRLRRGFLSVGACIIFAGYDFFCFMSDGLCTFLRLLHSGFYTLLNPLCAFLDALFRFTEYASLGSSHCWDEHQDQTARKGKQDFVRYSFYGHRLLLTALQMKSHHLSMQVRYHRLSYLPLAI